MMIAIHGVSIGIGSLMVYLSDKRYKCYNACYPRCIYQIRDSNAIILIIYGVSIR